MNIVTKNGGKKARKIFYQKQTNIASKKRWKKSFKKSAKTRFFNKHTNIVTKKWGEKTREKIFPETHAYRGL